MECERRGGGERPMECEECEQQRTGDLLPVMIMALDLLRLSGLRDPPVELKRRLFAASPMDANSTTSDNRGLTAWAEWLKT